MSKIIIEGLGYRELEKLGQMLQELGEKGSYKGISLTPTLEGYYDSKLDILELNDEDNNIVEYIED